jgi:hypothetical protein
LGKRSGKRMGKGRHQKPSDQGDARGQGRARKTIKGTRDERVRRMWSEGGVRGVGGAGENRVREAWGKRERKVRVSAAKSDQAPVMQEDNGGCVRGGSEVTTLEDQGRRGERTRVR